MPHSNTGPEDSDPVPPRSPRPPVQTRDVREWAWTHGYVDLPARGRVPAEVLDAYLEQLDACPASTAPPPGTEQAPDAR